MRRLSELTPVTAPQRPVKHESAELHVSGEARYIDDLPAPANLLHAYPVKGPQCSGLITRIDLDDVAASPGVRAVLTALDVPGHVDIGPVFPGDMLFAEQRMDYPGQPVALVVAESYHQARQAAAKVVVDVVKATPVLDAKSGHQQQSYVRPTHQMQHGDAEQALATAPHLLSGELQIGGQEHFYLEGQVALALPGEDHEMLVHSSSQHPSEVQKLVAEVLGLGLHQVTVITRRMGGGFGGKETQAAPWACLAALAARHCQRPVKVRLARSDDMQLTGKRHAFTNEYRVGFDEHGHITASDITVNGLCGHSPDLSDGIVDRAMFHTDNAYDLGAVSITGHRIRTDTVSQTAFRGFGGPQGMMTMEHVLDGIARQLGEDPLTIRKRNLYGAQPERGRVTPYGMELDHFWAPEIIAELEQRAQYWQRREQIRTFNEHSPIIKKGLALTPVKFGISFTSQHLNQAGALLHVYTDGTVQVNHGGTEMGQGLYTKVGQIVARCFGISLEQITVTATRTDKVPNTSPTAASSGTDLNGKAAENGALIIRKRLINWLAEQHHCDAADIRFANNRVSGPDFTLDFAEVIQQAYFARISLSATGFYQTPKIYYDHDKATGRPFFYFAEGAACSEVAVDTLTGEYKLLRTDILHDVGESLNRDIDMGQIQGGFIQGMGWLTSEELVWGEQGQLLSQSPATYKIPAISDVPAEFNVQLFDRANPEETVYHSKAVGEPPFMLAISVWSALRDALSSLTHYQYNPQLDVPATPERVLTAAMALQSRMEHV